MSLKHFKKFISNYDSDFSPFLQLYQDQKFIYIIIINAKQNSLFETNDFFIIFY